MALYTMGYEGLDGRRFLSGLLHHDVDVVADIRKLPISRKKGFSKTALKEMLNNKNIEYLNFQGLGAPKEIRDELYKSSILILCPPHSGSLHENSIMILTGKMST